MNYIHPPNKQLYSEQVWAFVRQIPYGKVSTYGQIAKLLPRPQEISAQDYKSSGPRWVGLALAACPDDVPWHRVINSQGKISHNAEPGRQRKLLESEGLVFSFQKLDLNIHQWHGPGHRDQPEQGNLF